jgi:hypothetical protein
MGPPLYVRSVVNRNVVMRSMTVYVYHLLILRFKFFGCDVVSLGMQITTFWRIVVPSYWGSSSSKP